MAAPIRLREDYDGARLRALAKASNDADQTRRLLALAAIYDGGSRTTAARIGGVGLQVIRDWVLRFNEAGPDRLINGKAPGNAPKLTPEQRQALAEVVRNGPIPAVHGVVRWRLADVAQWIFETFGISMDESTVGKELRRLGFRKLSARPRHHAQDPDVIEDYKKTSPPEWRKSGRTSRRIPG